MARRDARDSVKDWDSRKEPLFTPLSAEQERKYLEFDRQGFIHRRMHRWDEAVETYLKCYEYLLDNQLAGHRFHKGGPLHFLGMCNFNLRKNHQALRYFLLAYVEDLLSKPKGQHLRAETEAAALALRSLKVDEAVVNSVRRVALEKRRGGIMIQDPNEVLKEGLAGKGGAKFLRSVAAAFPAPAARRFLSLLDTPWAKRVFVGGNYNNLATLKEIKEAILRAGDFDPILANEFEMPEKLIHHHTLMLLHTCKQAIFDISFEGGHLMEIERLRDYQIRPLVVYLRAPDQAGHLFWTKPATHSGACRPPIPAEAGHP